MTCKECMHCEVCKCRSFMESKDRIDSKCLSFKLDNTKEIDAIYTDMFKVVNHLHHVESSIDDLHEMLVDIIGKMRKV